MKHEVGIRKINTLKDSQHHLDLFAEHEIISLEERIFTKVVRKKDTAYLRCIIRDKDIQFS